jgi:hypothetical protein
MEWVLLLIVVIAIALLAFYFYSRNQGVRPRTYPAREPDRYADRELTERGEYRVVADPTKGDYTHAVQDQHPEYDRIQERGAAIQSRDDLGRENGVGDSNR